MNPVRTLKELFAKFGRSVMESGPKPETVETEVAARVEESVESPVVESTTTPAPQKPRKKAAKKGKQA